jgi:hypothetical protein
MDCEKWVANEKELRKIETRNKCKCNALFTPPEQLMQGL